MATANTKSNAITYADATQPPQLIPSHLSGGGVRASVGTVEVATADDDGSVYRLCRLPSNAMILRIELLNDSITGGTAYDIGVYQTARHGGAVVDADVFATDVDLSMEHALPLDVMFEAENIDKVEKRLWEHLGLTSDSMRDYDVCATADTVGSGAGTISMRIWWTV